MVDQAYSAVLAPVWAKESGAGIAYAATTMAPTRVPSFRSMDRARPDVTGIYVNCPAAAAAGQSG